MPAVVFRAEQEVHQQNCCGGSGDDHEPVAEEQEAEHVVDLAGPDGRHDEVEFDENCGKGEEASYEGGRERAEGAAWGRDLARDLVGFCGRFEGL